MKLSKVKNILPTLDNVEFQLENGTFVPEHFHVTEVGVITKHFIDCGGTIRNEQVVNFQLWNANDFEHRLKPTKLLNIIKLSEEKLGMEDAEIILALKPSVEGETTTLYIKKIFENKNVKVTRLSYGIPMGVDIDYLDSLTLDKALLDRKEI